MERVYLLGMWQRYYKGATCASVTKVTFSDSGRYTWYEETSSFGMSVLGSASASSTSVDQGTFRLLENDQLEMVSDKTGRSVKPVTLEDGVLTIGYLPFTR
jgi:hypothetical protein